MAVLCWGHVEHVLLTGRGTGRAVAKLLLGPLMITSLTPSPCHRDAVGAIDGLDVEACEGFEDPLSGIQGQDEGAFELCQPLRHPPEIVSAEQRLSIIVLAAPIGRVEVEERALPVVTVDEDGPVEVFDNDPGQAIMGLLKERG